VNGLSTQELHNGHFRW